MPVVKTASVWYTDDNSNKGCLDMKKRWLSFLLSAAMPVSYTHLVVTVDATTGVVIAGPDIVSRGFVYVKEAEDLMEELRNISQMALDRCAAENLRDWNSLKSAIKGDVSDYLFKKTKRSPMRCV